MPFMLLATSLSDGKRNLIMKWSTTPIRYLNSPPPPNPTLSKEKNSGFIYHAMHVFICHLFVRWKEQ